MSREPRDAAIFHQEFEKLRGSVPKVRLLRLLEERIVSGGELPLGTISPTDGAETNAPLIDRPEIHGSGIFVYERHESVPPPIPPLPSPSSPLFLISECGLCAFISPRRAIYLRQWRQTRGSLGRKIRWNFARRGHEARAAAT